MYTRVSQRGADFKNLGDNLKVCDDELILEILELQMKSKKKSQGVYIGNFENYTRYPEVADEIKGLNRQLPF